MNMASVPGAVRSPFGVLPDGTEVERVTLHAPDGLEAHIITYGAALQALQALQAPLVPTRLPVPCSRIRRFRAVR